MARSQTPAQSDSMSLAAGRVGWKMTSRGLKTDSLAIRPPARGRSDADRSVSNIGIWTFSTAVNVGRR